MQNLHADDTSRHPRGTFRADDRSRWSDVEMLLVRHLPRPEPDEAFVRSLRGSIASGDLQLIEPIPDVRSARTHVYRIGGAVVGAAAIAIGASLRWRRARGGRAA